MKRYWSPSRRTRRQRAYRSLRSKSVMRRTIGSYRRMHAIVDAILPPAPNAATIKV